MSAEENAVILVAGATGILGSQICRLLVEQGKTVRALVRSTSDPGKVHKLKQLGVELVVGDLKDRPSLDAACQGVASVSRRWQRPFLGSQTTRSGPRN